MSIKCDIKKRFVGENHKRSVKLRSAKLQTSHNEGIFIYMRGAKIYYGALHLDISLLNFSIHIIGAPYYGQSKCINAVSQL